MDQATVASAFFLLVTSAIFTVVNHEQPDPYMDEIFHIPQAQNYCHLHYHHWNDKITTLPGLYLASQIPLTLLSMGKLETIAKYCQVSALRLTNVVFIVGCYFVIARIIKLLHYESEKGELKDDYFNAFNVAMFPLLYFFTFLYYTDVGSTFFVLLGYYYSLNNSHITSSIAGALAVLFRQTNVVWVGFIAASSILRYLTRNTALVKDQSILDDVLQLIKGCFLHSRSVFMVGVPYAFVSIAFVGFVIRNNGIVVGDRAMHEASFNVPQILYLSLFIMSFSLFLLPRYFNPKRLQKIAQDFSVKKLLVVCVILCAMFIVVYKLTYVHKYLVSDNRHYTFYVWRKILNRHWIARYVLVPVYLISWILILTELQAGTGCTMVWRLLYFLCCFASLVPQKLLEFRYFIIPYVLFRVHITKPTSLELFMEFVLYSFINAATLYLFLHKTYYWDGDDSQQRFMW